MKIRAIQSLILSIIIGGFSSFAGLGNTAVAANGSCKSACGSNSGSCWCDDLCMTFGDCCYDACQECRHCTTGSCLGNCGEHSGTCYCDTACVKYKDCCEDAFQYCLENNEFFYPPFGADFPNDGHRFDQLYYIQPHNSYDHDSKLINWLNKGYRSLELDVIDVGDWEKWPKGPYVSHSRPPKNVNCGASDYDQLGHCFEDIIAWMNTNTKELPLLVFVDMKTSIGGFASAWKPDEVADLDEFVTNYLSSRLGGRFYKYIDLINRLSSYYSGSYRNTLRNVGWPTVAELKGKLIVVLTGGHHDDVNDRMESALAIRGASQGTFFCPDIDAADPGEFSGTIDSISSFNSDRFFCGNVRAGDHYQITANRASEYKQIMHLHNTAGDFSNTSYEATWIAVAHGVSAIGWDLDKTNDTPSWTSSSIPLVGVRRSLPGYFKLHPKLSPDKCLEVAGSDYSNGEDILQYTCHSGNNQRFVYTAEGQLRPKGNNIYCVDFSSGSADNGDDMHIWDCDGGNSEKWAIQESGLFRNRDNGYTHCMDVPGYSTSNGVQLHIWDCHGGNNQQFILESVPDWSQSSF